MMEKHPDTPVIQYLVSRTKRIFTHSEILWSLIFTGLRMGSGILVLPLALRKIPTAEMGIYYTFMSLSAMAMLLDFGMVGTIGRSASYAWGGASSFTGRGLPEHHGRAEPNRALLASLTHVTRTWYYVLAIVAGLLLALFGTFFINQRIREAGLDPGMSLCWLFFAFVTAYSLGTAFWNQLLIGIGDVTNVGKYGVISQSFSTAILVAGLLCGFKIWAYAVSLLIGPAICRYLARKQFLRLLDHPLPAVLSCPDLSVLKSLWPMTWRMGVSILGIVLIQRGNILISSAFLGLEETAKYGLTLNLFSILFQLAGIPLYTVTPRIAQAYVRRDLGEVGRLFFMRAYGGLALALLGAVMLVALGPQILVLIGSKTSMLPKCFASILFLILLLDTHQNHYTNLVLASNENPFVLPTVLSGVCMISLSLWVTPRFGLPGLLLSHGLVQLAWNHWWPVVRGLQVLKMTPGGIRHPASPPAA